MKRRFDTRRVEKKGTFSLKHGSYKSGAIEQPYYWFQGIGKITACPVDILCTVAYVDEHWHGMDLKQADLGVVDKDGDFSVDSQGMLICTRPDALKFSIDQSTAELVYSS